jgi:hypothetical protein
MLQNTLGTWETKRGGRKQIKNMFILKQVKTNVASIYQKFWI